jgi:hypothetical protein
MHSAFNGSTQVRMLCYPNYMPTTICGLRFAEHYEDLMSALEEAGEDYENKWAVFSVYNAPWELKDRHNEVSNRTSQRTAGCRCFSCLFLPDCLREDASIAHAGSTARHGW